MVEMAEARSIALVGHDFRSGVGLNVDPEGVHLQFRVTIPTPAIAFRRLVRWTRLSFRLLGYLTYPISNPAVVISSLVTFVAIVLASPRDSWLRSGRIATAIWNMSFFFPWVALPQPYRLPIRVGVLAAWTGLGLLVILAFLQRQLLKMLLMDKTWLYAGMGRSGFNWWVQSWFGVVRMLTRGKPMTYAFQGSLPRAPVPQLADTVEKYLEYARVLQSDEEFTRTEEAARSFLSNEGPKLQRYLYFASWFKPHYMTDWWEKYVYLKGRSSIAINSNYYVLDSGRFCPTPVQEARAATLTYAFMLYARRLAEELIPPVMLGDTVPMSMEQFVRMFATTRIPGRDIDTIKHWDPETITHVAVACKGSLYRLTVVNRDGTLRTPDELEAAYAAIKRDAAGRNPAVRKAESVLPVLTSENRTRWAEVRETHFAEGVNRRSLNTIEQALMYVVLEDTATELLDWTGRGRQLFHGNRERPALWFDKSIQLIVYTNGKAGLNCEHSWADAPVPAHAMELSMIVGEVQLDAYDRQGHCRPWKGGKILLSPGPGSAGKVVPKTPEPMSMSIKDASYGPAAVHAPAPGVPTPAHTQAQAAEGGAAGDITAADTDEPGNHVAAAPPLSLPASAFDLDTSRTTSSPTNTTTSTSTSGGTGMVRSKSQVMGHSITEAPSGPKTPLLTPGSNISGPSGTALAPIQLGENGWARLSWSLSAECEEVILQALEHHQAAIDNIDLLVVPHSGYGKDFVKRCKVSPDAYIQSAMQLAWYRDQGSFANTYESSMTRLWLHGRTETVRPVTREMVSFVRTMEDKDASPAEKLRALQGAAHRHVRGYTDAMAGRGIDRHLFALYVTSLGMGYDSPFLKGAISTPWRLSTSQQPQQQTNLWDIKDPKWATRVSPGGGFGPVADDGLGVSYQALEREFIFHISGFKKAAPKVDAKRFRDRLFEAFEEMKTVLTLAVDSRDAQAAAQAQAAGGRGGGGNTR